MGIDYSGGMIVGESGSLLSPPEDFDGDMFEWAEENDMDYMSEHYDATGNYCIFGFSVKDVLVDDINNEWVESIRKRAKKFKEITGVPAKLIGTQNIY